MKKTKSKKEEIVPEETSPITEDGASPMDMGPSALDEAVSDDISSVARRISTK